MSNELIMHKRREMFCKALNLELSAEEFEIFKINRFFKIENCYKIENVRKCFNAYFSKQIDKNYFYKWCEMYSRLIIESYELKRREDIAYSKISDILYSVGCYNASPIKSLAEIEIHNEVLEGKREADYEISADSENFTTDIECGDDNLVDLISINHRNKTYIIYRGVSYLFADGGYDLLGEESNYCSVSRVVFEAICKEIKNVGYHELIFKED